MGLVVGTIEAVTGILGCPVTAWRIIPMYYYIKSAFQLKAFQLYPAEFK